MENQTYNESLVLDYIYNDYYKGVDLTQIEPKELKRTVKHGLQYARFLDLIEDKCPEWEYVSGYEDYKSHIVLQCKECGRYKTVSYQTLTHIGVYRVSRKGYEKTQFRVRCSNCEANKKEEEKLERQYDRNYRSFELETIRKCKTCGNRFIGKPSEPCCSSKCYETYWLTKKRHMRKVPETSKTSETRDITLSKVYLKYNGICYLCGKKCVISANMLDDLYPTIEHIIPVSKGGLDCWLNINLAHRRCNLLKGNRLEAKRIDVNLLSNAPY